MVTARERELSARYGLLTIGGSSTNLLMTGRYKIDRGAERGRMEFDFVVQESNEAAFAKTCILVEEAFRAPFLSGNITQGAQVLHVVGLNARPSIVKRGDTEFDTGRSRKYTAIVDYLLPASLFPVSGIRESTVTVNYTPARRRRISIGGTFVSAGARADYEARIDALASSVLTSLGVSVSELISERAGPEDQTGNILDFERIYEEIIYGQGQTQVADDPDIVEQQLVISQRDDGEGVTSEGVGGVVRRLAVVDLRYTAWITKGQSARAKYEDIRPWLLERITAEFGAAKNPQVALMEDKPEYSPDDNILNVTMTALVVRGGAKYVSRQMTTRDMVDEGNVLVPAWDKPLSRYRYQGPGSARRNVRETFRFIDDGIAGSAAAARRFAQELKAHSGHLFGSSNTPFSDNLDGSTWAVIRRDTSVTPLELSWESEAGKSLRINVWDVVAELEAELYLPVTSTPGRTGARPGPAKPATTPSFQPPRVSTR